MESKKYKNDSKNMHIIFSGTLAKISKTGPHAYCQHEKIELFYF